MARPIVHGTLILAILLSVAIIGCKGSGSGKAPADKSDASPARITFLELGSVSCIPCKKMQPVMKSIENRYAGQVKVVFHDVLKDRAPATQYGIKLIPTQIFLDQSGKEIMRHEGFFAEEEIDKFLKEQGVVPRS